MSARIIPRGEPRGAFYTGGTEKQFPDQPTPVAAPYFGYQPRDIFEAINIASGRLQVIQVREPRGSQYTGGIEQQFIPTPAPSEPSKPIQPLPEVLAMKGWSQRMDLLTNVEAPFLQIGFSFTNWLGLTKQPIPQTPDFLDPNVSVQKKTGYVVGSAVLLGLASLAIGIGYEEAKSGAGYVSEKIFGKTGPVTPGLVDVPDVGYTAPRTMSEKVLGLKLPETMPLAGLKGMEAEATATSFGTMPRTALLDPMISELTQPPALISEGWTPQSVFPYIPRADLTARTSLSYGFQIQNLIPALAGLPASYPMVAKPQNVTRLEPRFATNLSTGLKNVFRLDASISQTLKQSAITETVQVTTQRQKPITVQRMEPRMMEMPRMKAQFDVPSFDFRRFDFGFGTTRRKRGAARKSIWEWPISGPSAFFGQHRRKRGRR